MTPLAGLSFAALVPIVTIFSAAMAGSLLAPAVSSAARSANIFTMRKKRMDNFYVPIVNCAYFRSDQD